MRIFSSVESQKESNFPFLYIIRFQTYRSLEPPSSTRGRGRHMRSWTSLYEIQFEQLLFKAFLDVVRIFGSISTIAIVLIIASVYQLMRITVFPLLLHPLTGCDVV